MDKNINFNSESVNERVDRTGDLLERSLDSFFEGLKAYDIMKTNGMQKLPGHRDKAEFLAFMKRYIADRVQKYDTAKVDQYAQNTTSSLNKILGGGK